MKITLKNNLHNTEIELDVENCVLTKNQFEKVKRELCGIEDCQCGIVRGPQSCYVKPYHNPITGLNSLEIWPK